MKHLKKMLALFLMITSFVFSQDKCSSFYPFEEGVTFQITSYSKKNKVAAITDYQIIAATNNTATINTSLKDKRGDIMNEGEFTITCDDNGISMDLKSLLNPQLFEQFQDFEANITGDKIIIPNNLSIGQKLPDAAMKMQVDMAGIPMKMNVTLTDRKVVGQEKITTPAGTFECYVITYTSVMKMGMKKTGTAKQWIAKGVGMVKQEDYNRRGRVTSSSLLTDFHR